MSAAYIVQTPTCAIRYPNGAEVLQHHLYSAAGIPTMQSVRKVNVQCAQVTPQGTHKVFQSLVHNDVTY